MANPFTPEQISQILEEFFKVVGTRQYIGARYVPIFGRKGEESIEWDNSAPYEPLTIVLYQGNSYTSRQYVPVGVEITNQEFWAITGNYNAQVEQYRKEVRDILPYDETPTEGSTKGVTSDGIKRAIDTAVSTETTRATQAEQVNATAIANEVTRAKGAEQTNATAIANEVTRAKEAEQANATAIATNIRELLTHVVVIGDSFSDENSRSYAWPSVLRNTYTVHNYAKSGAGYLDVTTTTNTFPVQLDTAIADNTYNHNHVRSVIIYGGLNDFLHGQTGENCAAVLKNMYIKASKNFPNANIIVGALNAPNPARTTRWTKNDVTKWEDAFQRYTFYIPICYTDGILTPYTKSVVYSEDGIHPTATGMNIIAEYFMAAINGCLPRKRVSYNASPDDNPGKDIQIFDDWMNNFTFRGRFTIDLRVGNTSFNMGLAQGFGRVWYDNVIVPIPFAAADPNVRNVYFAPNSCELFVVGEAERNAINIYL